MDSKGAWYPIGVVWVVRRAIQVVWKVAGSDNLFKSASTSKQGELVSSTIQRC